MKIRCSSMAYCKVFYRPPQKEFFWNLHVCFNVNQEEKEKEKEKKNGMYWLFCDDKMYDVTLTSKKRKRKKLLCVKLAKKYLLIHTTLLSFRLGWNFSKDLIPGCVCVYVCVCVCVCVCLCVVGMGWNKN